MNLIVSAVVLVALLCAMIVLFVKNLRFKELVSKRSGKIPVFLLICTCLVTVDLASGDDVTSRLPWDLMLCLIPMMLMTSSLWETLNCNILLGIFASVSLLTAVYYACTAFSIIGMLPPVWFCAGAVLLAIVMAGLYFYGILRRIRNIRAVMKNSTVWSNLCLATDSIYVVMILIYMSAFMLLSSVLDTYSGVHSYVLDVLVAATVCAHTVRVISDSTFVFLHTHERRIVESMKITQVDAVSDISKIDDHYKSIYERVVDYFEDEKPYLNGELTINDVVKVVYTNKLYISRAISQFTGRNFCQFVNYYRVMYSMELFRSNPELKIHELATLSGFNSIVSFNMAFRLFMGEIPSEWCRREKGKLPRKKK